MCAYVLSFQWSATSVCFMLALKQTHAFYRAECTYTHVYIRRMVCVRSSFLAIFILHIQTTCFLFCLFFFFICPNWNNLWDTCCLLPCALLCHIHTHRQCRFRLSSKFPTCWFAICVRSLPIILSFSVCFSLAPCINAVVEFHFFFGLIPAFYIRRKTFSSAIMIGKLTTVAATKYDYI